jgi:hypothetical protein
MLKVLQLFINFKRFVWPHLAEAFATDPLILILVPSLVQAQGQINLLYILR